MSVLSLDEEWIIQQIPRLYEERPDLLHPFLDSLLTDSEDLRWALVVQAYQEQRLNLGKAAELLGLHELELREQFIELGIPLRLGPADLDEALAEVRAAQAWYETAAGRQQP